MQVGDPFTEKLLIEACLELMQTDAIVAIQDMGAAGLTSSSVEMAGKGNVGIALNLDMVPARETGMTAYEFMLSESQERMLMVLRPDRQELARGIFEKWDLDFAVVGELTDNGRLIVRHQGNVEADIPLGPLNDQAPLYTRSTIEPPKREKLNPARIEDRIGLTGALRKLIACPDLCSRAWVWDQYDSTVGGQTVKRPGAADAAVVKLEGLSRGLALTTDCTPRYCFADPELGGCPGGGGGVAEFDRGGSAAARHHRQHELRQPGKTRDHGPVRRRDPRHGGGVRRLWPSRSCPATSRSTTRPRRSAILPTPAIGGLGVLDDVTKAVGLALQPWLDIVLIGATIGWLGQSLWLREVAGREDGAPPPVDLTSSAPTAISCALGSWMARSAPVTTFRTAACWWRSPRWRWPAASAAASSRTRAMSPATPSGSARTRRAI